ncbi:MAG: hypothetical protein AB7S70_04220 [Hyphomicrobium sp.]
MRQKILDDAVEDVPADVVVGSRLDRPDRPNLEDRLPLEEALEVLLRLLDGVTGRNEMLLHDLVELLLDAVHRLLPNRGPIGPLVEDVVRCLRPGVVQDRLQLDLAGQTHEARVFRQRGPVGLEPDDKVIPPELWVGGIGRVMDPRAVVVDLEVLSQHARVHELLQVAVSVENDPAPAQIFAVLLDLGRIREAFLSEASPKPLDIFGAVLELGRSAAEAVAGNRLPNDVFDGARKIGVEPLSMPCILLDVHSAPRPLLAEPMARKPRRLRSIAPRDAALRAQRKRLSPCKVKPPTPRTSPSQLATVGTSPSSPDEARRRSRRPR